MTVVEFNLYRYKQIEVPNRGKALIVYAYSKEVMEMILRPFSRLLRIIE